MKININNIEEYILDYYEDKLSEILKEELFIFLSNHPEWRVIFDEFEVVQLEPIAETLSEDFKRSLKKEVETFETEISDYNLDYFLIRELEGDLNSSEKSKLKKFLLKNPQYIKDKNVYSLTILKPDYGMVYPYKDQLKRGAKKVYFGNYFFRYASIAAVIIFLLVVSRLVVKEEIDLPISEVGKNLVTPETASDSPYRKSKVEQSGKEVSAEENNIEKSTIIRNVKKEVYNSITMNEQVAIMNNVPTQSHIELIPMEIKGKSGVSFSYIDFDTMKTNQPSNCILASNSENVHGFGNRIINKINLKMGAEIVKKSEDRRATLNWRNLLIASAKFIKNRKQYIQRKEHDNSEMIAIKIGELQIGRAFSK